jgi:hypothetical protein
MGGKGRHHSIHDSDHDNMEDRMTCLELNVSTSDC